MKRSPLISPPRVSRFLEGSSSVIKCLQKHVVYQLVTARLPHDGRTLGASQVLVLSLVLFGFCLPPISIIVCHFCFFEFVSGGFFLSLFCSKIQDKMMLTFLSFCHLGSWCIYRILSLH